MTFLIKPLIALTCLICLCVAAIALINSYGNIDLSVVSVNIFVLPAFFVQVLATLFFVLAWKLLLRYPGGLQATWLESSSHIGVTLLGKYIPGKIWGLMGRGFLLGNRGMDTGNIANLLILDQALTFSSGVFVMVAGLALLYTGYWSLVLILLLYIGFRSLSVIYPWVARQCFRLFAKGLKQVGKTTNNVAITDVSSGDFLQVFLVYLIHWLLTGIALSLLVFPLLSEQPVHNVILVIAAIPAAMLTGFVTLWAPGGIGVREVVMVGLLSTSMSLETAGAIAIFYRIVCILIDLIVGGIAVTYLARNNLTGFLSKA